MNEQLVSIANDSLLDIVGGAENPGFWQRAGEYAAPLLMTNPVTAGLGVRMANKPALAQGAIWGAGGAVAGARGGLPGMGLGALGGGLAGYYSTLVGRDFPAQ